MRKVDFMAPVENVSGKWAPNKVVASPLNGIEQFISRRINRFYPSGLGSFKTSFTIYHGQAPRALSAEEITARTRFAAIAVMVKNAFIDPDKIAEYRRQWKASGRDITLRKFVWEKEIEIYDADPA